MFKKSYTIINRNKASYCLLLYTSRQLYGNSGARFMDDQKRLPQNDKNKTLTFNIFFVLNIFCLNKNKSK